MNDINKTSEAYNTGFEARVHGERKADCPYLAGTIDAINWMAGYSDAGK